MLIVFTLLNRVPCGKFNRVNNKMGFSFLESVYEKCLLIEMRKAGLDTEPQKPITVYYDGEAYFTGEIQLVNYLVATGKPVGVILNIGERKVEIKCKVKDLS